MYGRCRHTLPPPEVQKVEFLKIHAKILRPFGFS
jgi:hypothetical protein